MRIQNSITCSDKGLIALPRELGGREREREGEREREREGEGGREREGGRGRGRGRGRGNYTAQTQWSVFAEWMGWNSMSPNKRGGLWGQKDS